MCPEVTLFTQWPPQSDELSQRLRWGGHTWSGSRLEMVSQEFVETAFKTSCSLNPFFLLSLFLFFLPSLRTNKAFFKHHLYAKVVMLIIVVLAEGKSNQMTKSPCSPRPYHLWGETNALYGGPVVKNPPANAGNTGSIPGVGGFHIPWSSQARVPQLLKPSHPEPVLHTGKSHHGEKPAHCS